MSDVEAKWSKSMKLDKDLSAVGFGVRTERYALVLENNIVKYVGVSIYFKQYHNAHVPEVELRSNLAPKSRSQELMPSSPIVNKDD